MKRDRQVEGSRIKEPHWDAGDSTLESVGAQRKMGTFSIFLNRTGEGMTLEIAWFFDKRKGGVMEASHVAGVEKKKTFVGAEEGQRFRTKRASLEREDQKIIHWREGGIWARGKQRVCGVGGLGTFELGELPPQRQGKKKINVLGNVMVVMPFVGETP